MNAPVGRHPFEDLGARLDEDVDQIVRPVEVDVTEAFAERRLNVLQRATGQPLVEDRCQRGQCLTGQTALKIHINGADDAGLEREDQKHLLRVHLDEVHASQDRARESRPDREAELAGQQAENRCRARDELLDRARLTGDELTFDAHLLRSRKRLTPHQLIDVVAVGKVRGHAAGRRMRMGQETLGLQIRHRVPHRGRRNAQPVLHRDRT